MGLHLRVERLVRAAPNEARGKEMEHAANRLVDKAGMGREYKVLGVVGRDAGKDQAEADTNGNEIWPFVEKEA